MTSRNFRKRWLILKLRYERRAARIFRKELRKTALSIPFDQLDGFNYRFIIGGFIKSEHVREAYRKTYYQTGRSHGLKIGRGINKEIRKNFGPVSFEALLTEFIRSFLLNQGGKRITLVTRSLADYMINFISNGVSQGNDIRTIARNLQKHIKTRDFYRWQIERIVRTETTAAANYGAVTAAEDSGLVMEKIWISSNDTRTRQIEKGDQYDHMDMHLVRVGQHEKFNVQGDFLDVPGDPHGQPGNVINCRCTVSLAPKRDANGRLIFADDIPGALR